MTKSTITRERARQIFLGNGPEPSASEERELARMALAAMGSETAIADCDPEVYEKGVSVCLVAIPKETAEIICQNITAATGCKVDWHYFGGRVHIKALRESSQPAPVGPKEMTAGIAVKHWEGGRGSIESFVAGYNFCRATMLQAGNSPAITDG